MMCFAAIFIKFYFYFDKHDVCYDPSLYYLQAIIRSKNKLEHLKKFSRTFITEPLENVYIMVRFLLSLAHKVGM